MIEGLSLGFGILSFAATIVIAVLADRLVRGQAAAERQRERVAFFEFVDTAARARQQLLLGVPGMIDVDQLEQLVRIRGVTVDKPEYLWEGIVLRDLEVLANVPSEHRADFVPQLDRLRALNGREWVRNPDVEETIRAHWASGSLSLHGTLSATAATTAQPEPPKETG